MCTNCGCSCNSSQPINNFIGKTGAIGPIGPIGPIGEAGADGNDGADGTDGLNGWTSETAIVEDSERRVKQVVDWFGGTGDKPSTTDIYLGAGGFVNTAAAATDVRGAQGEQGEPGADGEDITNGRIKASATDIEIDYLENKIGTDGSLTISKINEGGNEIINLSTKSVVSDQYSSTYQNVTTSEVAVFSYLTPDDGFIRKYKIDFNAVGYIVELDSFGRTSILHFYLYIDGVEIKNKAFPLYSTSGYSRSEHDFTISYAGAIPANKTVVVKVKKDTESPVANTLRINYHSLSIFGIL